MDKNLTEYLAGKQCQGFKARPQYFQDGDYVTFFFQEGRAVEDRIDSLVTVYRSMATKEMVGCKVKGVKRILDAIGEFGALGILIRDGKVNLAVLLLGAALVNPNQTENYKRVSSDLPDTPIDSKELPLQLAA